MNAINTLLLIAACAVSTGATGQNLINSKSVEPLAFTACPEPQDVSPLHLYGLWRAEFSGPVPLPGATLLFEKHAELAGSVAGGINRNGTQALIAGDVDEGEFTLEESSDGKTVSALWSGHVEPGSCGKTISGDWNDAASIVLVPFVLRKLPGWQ